MTRLYAVLGPTAAGKSDVALALAEELGAEIVSVDSMQVYRGMDIGTAKPSRTDRARIRHHLLDLVEPEQDFTVADFQQAGRRVFCDTQVPLLIVGGSGLHFRSLVDPMEFPPHDPDVRREIEGMAPGEAERRLLAMDPEAAAHVDLANPRRVARALEVALVTGQTPSARAATEEYRALQSYRARYEFVAVGLDPGELLAGRVAKRLGLMMDAGLLGEVEELAPRMGRTARQAVGYKELLPVIEQDLPTGEGVAAAVRATLALAKRQRTYFRRDPRIHWVPWDENPKVRLSVAKEWLTR